MKTHTQHFRAPQCRRRRIFVALASAFTALACAVLAAASTNAQDAEHVQHAEAAEQTQHSQPARPSGHARHAEDARHGQHSEHAEHSEHSEHSEHLEHLEHLEHSEHSEHAEQARHAQQTAQTEHAEHTEHTEPSETPASPELPPPTPAERAAAFPDLGGMDIRHIEHDDPFNTFVLLDQLEIGDRDEGSVLHWDLKAWAGRDLSKLWVRSRGERRGGSTEHAELELLWGRALGPWWDWVAGVRHDFKPGPSRTWAALGLQGLAPYWFELEGTLYLGEGGRAAATFEAEYELLVTNRLIVQPVFKLEWHSEDDPERGIGSGLGSAEAGLRLRYEIRREVAPYVGIVRERRFGGSADLARAAGSPARDTWLVAGVRLWF